MSFVIRVRHSYYRYWHQAVPWQEEIARRDVLQRLAVAYRHYGYSPPDRLRASRGLGGRSQADPAPDAHGQSPLAGVMTAPAAAVMAPAPTGARTPERLQRFGGWHPRTGHTAINPNPYRFSCLTSGAH